MVFHAHHCTVQEMMGQEGKKRKKNPYVNKMDNRAKIREASNRSTRNINSKRGEKGLKFQMKKSASYS